MKYLSKMMNPMQMQTSAIKNVKYFCDLQITASFHRKFSCQQQHRKTECLKNRFSLEMILNGEVDLLLDAERIHLQGPCLFWIGDHHQHFQYEPIPGSDYEHLWIDFTGERGRRIYESLSAACPDSHFRLGSVNKLLPTFEYFARKFQTARRPDSLAEDVCLIEQLMLEIVREINLANPREMNDPYHLLALAEQIKNAPFERYVPQQLAKDTGLSYVHFRTLFKEVHGDTIHQFILKQQMQTAGELLKSGQFRIGELADYCRFPDLPSFTRAFKRYYKVSPKQWLAVHPDNSAAPDPD